MARPLQIYASQQQWRTQVVDALTNLEPTGYTVATLPTGAFGQLGTVSDGAAALAWGATVTGGGSTKYLVWFNGANWTVAGK